jgi:hypothetical protein
MITSMIILAAITFNYVELADTNTQYQSAYNYIATNTEVQREVMQTFRKALRKKEMKNWKFCIDTFAYALTISGFSEIQDKEKRAQIRKIDHGIVPHEIAKKSQCNCSETPYNMIFSILNGNFLTVEIASRKFNPLGGAAFGPSIKFLFEYHHDSSIKSITTQTYMNG